MSGNLRAIIPFFFILSLFILSGCGEQAGQVFRVVSQHNCEESVESACADDILRVSIRAKNCRITVETHDCIAEGYAGCGTVGKETRCLTYEEQQSILDMSQKKNTIYADYDGDGFGDPATGTDGYGVPAGYSLDNTDCDDFDYFVNPGAEEVCNGLDDDCDGSVDEGDACEHLSYYCDNDGDGFFRATPSGSCSSFDCAPLECMLSPGLDCDDKKSQVYPGAYETPFDDIDQDCDGFDFVPVECPLGYTCAADPESFECLKDEEIDLWKCYNRPENGYCIPEQSMRSSGKVVADVTGNPTFVPISDKDKASDTPTLIASDTYKALSDPDLVIISAGLDAATELMPHLGGSAGCCVRCI